MADQYLHLKLTDDDQACIIADLPNAIDRRTGKLCLTTYDSCMEAIAWDRIRPGSAIFQPSAVGVAEAAAESAQYDLLVAQAPMVDGWVAFRITSTAPGGAITAGTTGSCTATLTLDSGYTGTITFSAEEIPPLPNAVLRGITAVFSPPTLTTSASTTGVTISVPGGTPAGGYTIAIIGTDAAGLGNRALVNFTVV